MKFNLKKNITIEVFDAVVTLISFNSNRQDVISLLEFIDENGLDIAKLKEELGCETEDSDLIVNGILNYLRREGLVVDGHLTGGARNILDTKLFPVKEHGKYKFWWMKDDHFGEMFIGFKREQALEYSGQVTPKSSSDFAELFDKKFINVRDRSQFVLPSKFNNDFRSIVVGDDLKTKSQLVLYIDTGKEIKYNAFFEGSLLSRRGHPDVIHGEKVFLDIEIDWQQFVISLIRQKHSYLNWDYKDEKFLITGNLDVIKNRNDLKNFRTSLWIGDEGGKINTNDFGELFISTIEDIPIAPGDNEIAKQWAAVYMDTEIAAKYISEETFTGLIEDLNRKEEFKRFDEVLKRTTVSDYCKQYKDMKQIKNYWHLQAPIDLNPQKTYKFITLAKPLHILNQNLSFDEIIERLIGDDIPEKLVYASKYLKDVHQNRKFELFAQSFRNFCCEEIHLITADTDKVKDTSFIVSDYTKIMGIRNLPHDRYFAYYTNEEWKFFKMSAELDRCTFRDPRPTAWKTETKGMWGDISFMRIEKDMFPPSLVKYLERI